MVQAEARAFEAAVLELSRLARVMTKVGGIVIGGESSIHYIYRSMPHLPIPSINLRHTDLVEHMVIGIISLSKASTSTVASSMLSPL